MGKKIIKILIIIVIVVVFLILIACYIGEGRTFYADAFQKQAMFSAFEDEYKELLDVIADGNIEMYFLKNNICLYATETIKYPDKGNIEEENEITIDIETFMRYISKLKINEVPFQEFTAEVVRSLTFPMPTFAKEGEYILHTTQEIKDGENDIFTKQPSSVSFYCVFGESYSIKKLMYIFHTIDSNSYYTFSIIL